MADSMTQCNRCRYQGRTGDRTICDYMQHTGRARSLICPPGDACTVFEPGENQKKTRKGLSIVAEAVTIKTGRERVEELVREGKSNREIAALTGLPVKTVANYRYRMKKPVSKPVETMADPPPEPETPAEGRPWISRLCVILDMAGQETDAAVRKTIRAFALDYAAAQIEREVSV